LSRRCNFVYLCVFIFSLSARVCDIICFNKLIMMIPTTEHRFRGGAELRSVCVNGAKINAKQETQLSQRGRAMLRVIEYFAKSLDVTQLK